MLGHKVAQAGLAVGLVAVMVICTGCNAGGELELKRREVNPEALGVDVTAGNIEQTAKPSASESSQKASTTKKPQSASAASTRAPQQGSPSQQRESTESSQVSQRRSTPATVRQKADVGVGKKGHYGEPGLITTPVETYFRAREAIVFRIQIPKAMQLYKATNGRYPQSFEEFKREILQPNAIQLPELPPGHRYVYDPKSGQLFVEYPR